MKTIKELLKEFILTIPKDEALKLLDALIENGEQSFNEWEDLKDEILTMDEE